MELSKEKLREEFWKQPDKYYKVKLFEELGFERKRCKICGRYFWTADPNRTTCDDSSHTPYSFFKEKPKSIGYVEFWKMFSKFFEENKHAIIDRYPVVSRWRQDLYFTIAGIQDFQRIENGVMSFEYPANPLLVPQMCMRFNDVENVGVTGRHFTAFMMANQTSFNWPEEGYWKDETIRINFEFLNKVLGIRKEDIIYHEDVWAMPDFSEFGPSLETFSKGLEIVNSVFTEFGLINNEIKELKGKVVDAGWGFERALWFYSGFDNAYEAAFGSIIRKIEEESGISIDTNLYRKFATYSGSLDFEEKGRSSLEKVLKELGISWEEYENQIRVAQAIYATVDHARTLLFAITDGALPSNIGGGYNLRVILRRAFDFIEGYGIKPSLTEIAELIAQDLKGLYPELLDSIDTFDKVISIERERYRKSVENAKHIAEVTIAKGNVNAQTLKTLYESYGITPELLHKIAKEKKVELHIEENAYRQLLTGDMVRKEKGKELPFSIEGLQPTKPLYYSFITKAKAKVVLAHDKFVVLDQTPFYPEGGGQEPDLGTINGVKVEDVQKVSGVILHKLENNPFKVGDEVYAEVDERRRNRLIAHHTATHLISAAARKLLGNHAWQEGAKKGPEKAHIDIAHYDKLSEEQLLAIENQVNEWLMHGIKVNAQEMDRKEAEGKFGFGIYQGHGVPAKTLRIVTITDLNNNLIDAEACGGLHAVGREYLLLMVKIIGSERIHDGVDRIEFVAGEAALRYLQREHAIIEKLAKQLNVEPEKIEERLKTYSESAEKRSKELEKGYDALAESLAKAYEGKEEVELVVDLPGNMLAKIGDKIAKANKKGIVTIRNKSGDLICIAGEQSGKSAIDYVKQKFKQFKGGGSAKFASGRVETA